MLNQGSLEIAIKYLPNPTDPVGCESDYSIPFTREIIQGNRPAKIRFHWDENRYRKDALDNSWNWLDWSSETFDFTAQAGQYCKHHQAFSFCIPFQPEPGLEIEEEIEDEPEISFTGNSREILRQNCQEAIWEWEGERWEIWYSLELQVPSHVQNHWGKMGIPGLILEMKALQAPDQLVLAQYQVTDLNLKPHPSLLEIPEEGYSPYTDSKAVKQALVAAWEAKSPQFSSQRDRFLGTWKLKSEADQIFLVIEEATDQYRIRLRFPERERVFEGAIWGKQGCYLLQGGEYIYLHLSSDGKTLSRTDHPAFQYQRVSP